MMSVIARSRLRYWIAGYIVLQVLDVATTVAAFMLSPRFVAVESNPLGIALWTHGGIVSLLLFKALIMALVMALLVRFDPVSSTATRALGRLTVALLLALVVVNNGYWLMRLALYMHQAVH